MKYKYFTKEESIEAIDENPFALQYVENQDEDICWYAINKNPYSYQNIRYPTKEMTDYCVSKRPYVLRYIEEQTLEMCKKGMSIDVDCFKYCKIQTRSMIKKAIDYEPRNIQHVIKQTESLCLYAIERATHSFNFKKIEDGSLVMYMEKKSNNIEEVFHLIRNKTPKIHLTVVGIDGMLLRYIGNQTEEICKLAISQNPKAIQFIELNSLEVWKYAYSIDEDATCYIPKNKWHLL
jgi:hypothetical protein